MDIKNKVAWITGGTSGMGLATAKRLVGHEAKVMISAEHGTERGDQVAAELGSDCFYVQAAVQDSPAMESAMAALIDRWGKIDILFSNAGGGGVSWCLPMAPTPESLASGGPLDWAYTEEGPATLESFQDNIAINLVGAFDAARLAAWQMRRNQPNEEGERGVMVFTSSISATKRHSPGFNCGYSAGKAGLLGMVKEIACNLAPLGIRANAVIPGFFDTQIVQSIGFLKESWKEAQIFPKQPGDPAFIAQMVAQIIENPFVNNAVIEVTAGFASTKPQA